MANSKNALLRLRIIDRCLRKAGGSSTAEIMEEVNRELALRGEPAVTASNTIRADVTFISNNWHISIQEHTNGRRHAYSYATPDFSIASAPLSAPEREQLDKTLMMLSRFSGVPGFGWVEETKVRIGSVFPEKEGQERVVAFENDATEEAMCHFETLFEAIIARRSLHITYHAFRSDAIVEADVFPYYLKQYNRRWFLLAGTPGYDSIGNYAVDRITEVREAEVPYRMPKVDFAHYFDSIVGVSFPDGATPETVRLWVSDRQYRYIETKPLHPSQRLTEEAEGGKVIELQVIPNYELLQRILMHGSDMKVLAPESLRLLMKEKITAMMKNYEQVHLD